MLHERITAWLQAPDEYQTGLDLLRETGYAKFTLTVLAMGDDAYNRTLLEKELSAYQQKNVLPIGVRSAMVAEQPSAMSEIPSPVSNIPSPGEEPEGVLAIRQQIGQCFDQRDFAQAFIHGTMDQGNTEAAMALRLPYSVQIKVVTRQLDELYSRLHFYEQHGYLPLLTDAAVELDDRALLMNARSNVSRNKKRLKRNDLTPSQRQDYERLLAQYSAEKQRLELKLSTNHDSHTSGQQTSDRPIHTTPLSTP